MSDLRAAHRVSRALVMGLAAHPNGDIPDFPIRPSVIALLEKSWGFIDSKDANKTLGEIQRGLHQNLKFYTSAIVSGTTDGDTEAIEAIPKEELINRYTMMKKNYAAFEKECLEREEELETLEREKMTLMNTKKSLMEQVLAHKATNEANKSMIASHEKDKKNKTREMKTMQDKHERAMNDERKEKENALEKVFELVEKLGKKDARVDQLKDEVSKTEILMTRLESDLEHLNDVNSKMVQAADLQQGVIDMHKSDAEAASEMHESLENQIQTLQDLYNELEAEYDQKEFEGESMKQKIKELKREIAKGEKVMNMHGDKMDELRTTHRDQMESWKELAETAVQNHRAAEDKARSLEDMVDDWESRHRDHIASLGGLEACFDLMNAEPGGALNSKVGFIVNNLIHLMKERIPDTSASYWGSSDSMMQAMMSAFSGTSINVPMWMPVVTMHLILSTSIATGGGLSNAEQVELLKPTAVVLTQALQFFFSSVSSVRVGNPVSEFSKTQSVIGMGAETVNKNMFRVKS